MALTAVALLAVGSAPAPAGEKRPTEAEIGTVQEYLSPGAAIREIFDDVAEIDTMSVELTAGELGILRHELGSVPHRDAVTLLLPRGADESLLGYAVIANELGKYRPITFLVGVTPDLRVRGVEVLVYRESRGGEVRRSRFLRQYRGKGRDDPLRINRDIINISGATISVNALNLGVRRVLLTLDLLGRREAHFGRGAR